MNIDRTDVFILGSILLNIYILFQFATRLSYDVVQSAVLNVSWVSFIVIGIFCAGILVGLHAIKDAIFVYFDDTENKINGAKFIGSALVFSCFLYVVLTIINRVHSF